MSAVQPPQPVVARVRLPTWATVLSPSRRIAF
jgi:hypothetical protein